ncbi:MAG: SDR family oxidoreductase [Flavobacteriales bacterium]|nr:MAG: SDR family oxidoreductase [Flavobacteriales bacterium]
METKVVLITGGSSGIGKTIGTYLSSKGHKVYGTTRSSRKYPNFDAFPLLEMDVRSPEDIKKAIAALIAQEGRLDVLINNAGVGITGPLEETPEEEIMNAFDTNFHGPIRVIKAVLPQMRKQGGGLVINITSIAAYMGLPYRGVYSATKAALEVLTEALRMETKAFGIQITNLAPGAFATNIAAGRYHVEIDTHSPYGIQYRNTLKGIDESVENGEDPIEVALKVSKIINNGNPDIHYTVGAFNQKLSIFLKKYLPQKVFEKILLNHYKL